jgi:hypothetical protein
MNNDDEGNSSDEPDLANINAIIPQLDIGCYCPYIAGIVVQNTTFTGYESSKCAK